MADAIWIPKDVKARTAHSRDLEGSELDALVSEFDTSTTDSENFHTQLDDSNPILPQAVTSSSHGELQLCMYEYANLDERYRTLMTQHHALHKLTSAYNDIILGFSECEGPAVSIEQLHAEASSEGLRSKALEADVLRPLIREAGGLHALSSQVQFLRGLLLQTGGLKQLQELVAETPILRASINEVGGLRGLTSLVSELKSLRSKQQENHHLKAQIEGMKAKALKYDKLRQIFNSADAEPCADELPMIDSTPGNIPLMQAETRPTIQRASPPDPIAMMNPARAALLSSGPDKNDPLRDLYDSNTSTSDSMTKTGPNQIPLGASNTPKRVGQPERGLEDRKRAHNEELKVHAPVAKRPRIDVDRASALLRPFIPPSGTQFARTSDLQPRSTTDSVMDHNAVKKEDQSDFSTADAAERPGVLINKNLPNNVGIAPDASYLMHNFGIAIWTGAAKSRVCDGPNLRRRNEVPFKLAVSLCEELAEHIGTPNLKSLNTMPLNVSVCVLRYLKGEPLLSATIERRVCGRCTWTCSSKSQPCAFLRKVDGIPTLVFMPLHDNLRTSTSYKDLGWWIMSRD